MKIKNDFVTNSSSSSYIIITTKETYEKMKKHISSLCYAFITHIKEETKMIDKEYIALQIFSSYSGYGSFDDIDFECSVEMMKEYNETYTEGEKIPEDELDNYDEKDVDIDYYELFYEYKDKLKKLYPNEYMEFKQDQ